MKKTQLILFVYFAVHAFIVNAQTNTGLTKVTLASLENTTSVVDTISFGDGIAIIDSLNYEQDSLEYQEASSVSIDVEFENPGGNMAYIDIFHDDNDDGIFTENEKIYSNSTTTNTLQDNFDPCKGLNKRMCITMKSGSTNNDPVSIAAFNSSGGNNGPPLIVTTSSNNKTAPNDIPYCVPETDILKFVVHNNSFDTYNLESVFVNDQSVELIPGPEGTEILPESILPFWINVGSLVEPLPLLDTHFVRCELAGGCVSTFKYKMIIGCCEGTNNVIERAGNLPYYIGIEDEIIVGDAVTNTVTEIVVEAKEEVFLEASNCIVMMPGFETKTDAIFEARLTDCTAQSAQREGEIQETSSTKKRSGLTTKQEIAKPDFRIFPNPFEEAVTIYFEQAMTMPVSIVVYNITGQQVMTILDNVVQEAGSHKMVMDTFSLPKGSYFFRLHAGDQTTVQKMIKL